MQAATADFKQEAGAASEDEIEGGASAGVTNSKKRPVPPRLKVATRS
jgi:hypothetical protein